jgi:ribosomal protein S25
VSSPFKPQHVAYAMTGTGLAFSLAANVTHGIVSDGGIGAVISGLVWPLSLVLTIEGAARLPWPRGGWWMALRLLTATPVAATAAIVSYLHMSGLLTHWDEHWLTCLLGPIAVDGLTTLGAAGLLILDRTTAADESARGPVHAAVEQPTEPPNTQMLGQPTEPAHRANVQVTGTEAPVARAKTPVSPEAIAKVMRAVRSGQPMGKSAIVSATGLSRSTATRAVDHLVDVGQLSSVGDPRRPDYVLAQSEVTQ